MVFMLVQHIPPVDIHSGKGRILSIYITHKWQNRTQSKEYHPDGAVWRTGQNESEKKGKKEKQQTTEVAALSVSRRKARL